MGQIEGLRRIIKYERVCVLKIIKKNIYIKHTIFIKQQRFLMYTFYQKHSTWYFIVLCELLKD